MEVAKVDEPMPRAALYLGLGGTIPFFTTAGLAASSADPALVAMATHGCVSYGCSILSFLGAVHWGVAIRSAAHEKTRMWDFAYSVCPSLAAAAAATMPDSQALITLLPGFAAAFVYDSVRFAGDHAVPKWYPKLRRPLTLTAMCCTGVCLGVLWTGPSLTDKSDAIEDVSEMIDVDEVVALDFVGDENEVNEEEKVNQ